MIGTEHINHWHILLVVLVLFILFGHRLPVVLRDIGRVQLPPRW